MRFSEIKGMELKLPINVLFEASVQSVSELKTMKVEPAAHCILKQNDETLPMFVFPSEWREARRELLASKSTGKSLEFLCRLHWENDLPVLLLTTILP